MKTITEDDIASGQKVLIRASLNVSLDEEGKIADDLRLRRITDTIDIVLSAGGVPVLLSHISNDQGSTLQPVVTWLRDFAYNTILLKNYYPYLDALANFLPHTVYVLENLRDYDGEKTNDPDFAVGLAKYGDLFVNESFDSAHRAHASTVGIPEHLPSYAGKNFAREIAELSHVFNPDRPFTFIIGGAKIETKVPLIKKLLDKADKVYVAGALMNPLLVAQGHSVGKSKMPQNKIDLSDIVSHQNLELPVDFVDHGNKVISIDEVQDDTQLLDIGPESTKAIELLIEESDLVAWNGPLGLYEGGYVKSTDQVAQKLADSDCYSIIGGGDTLAVLNSDIESKINWISTGGGAMLDFIESDGDLPAIKVLNQS